MIPVAYEYVSVGAVVAAVLVDAESVVRTIPAVTSITDSTCIAVYVFPTSIQPKSMLTINPPLLNMM